MSTITQNPPSAALEAKSRLVNVLDQLMVSFGREMALRIHSHPELSWEEHLASKWLADSLEKSGFDVSRGVANTPTAFRAAFDTSNEGPCVAFLAEYDAMRDTGHSCGHNLSGVASCLAGMALAEVLKETKGVRIRVLGTPAEEYDHGGKIRMLNHGVFKDVEFSMMAHAGYMNLPNRDMLGRRRIRCKFKAVRPGGNALIPMLSCMESVQDARPTLRHRSRIDAIVVNGGNLDRPKTNLPEDQFYGRSEIEILITSTEVAYINCLEKNLQKIARVSAGDAGADVEWLGEWHPYLPVRRNPAMEAIYTANLDFIQEPLGHFPDDWSIGCTDCGNVSQVIPTLHAYFKAAEPGIDHHTPGFAVASSSELGLKGMRTAALTMALTGWDLLLNPSLRDQVKNDFETIEKDNP